jgi:Ca2+/Na+ antiporter
MTIDNTQNQGSGQYKMQGSIIVVGIVVMVFLAVFFLVVGYIIYSTGKDNVTRIWMPAGMAVLAIPVILYAMHLYRIGKSIIEITSSGISRKENNGTQVSMMWTEMGKLTERVGMQQLAISDKNGSKKISVDYQFDGYDVIRKRVFDEFEKRMTVTYPAVFGRASVNINKSYIALFVILSAIFIPMALLDKKGDDKLWFLVVAGCVLLPVMILLVVDQVRTIKQVIVERESLKLKRLFGTVDIAFADIVDYEYKYIAPNYGHYNYTSPDIMLMNKTGGGQKIPVVEITTTANKKHKITRSIGALPELFLSLKKTCAKAGVSAVSAEVVKKIKASDLF